MYSKKYIAAIIFGLSCFALTIGTVVLIPKPTEQITVTILYSGDFFLHGKSTFFAYDKEGKIYKIQDQSYYLLNSGTKLSVTVRKGTDKVVKVNNMIMNDNKEVERP